MKNLILLFVAVVLVGCASVDVAPTNAPDIIVIGNHERKSGPNTFTLQSGRYFANFQSSKGVYYQSERKVIHKAVGFTRPWDGGLFVPHADSENQKQAVWVDQSTQAAGLVGSAIASPATIYRFKEPIPFKLEEIIKN